eukprot:scaffold17415_cov101-Skeletonema_dohrnii-CCMP3373.AAC.1
MGPLDWNSEVRDEAIASVVDAASILSKDDDDENSNDNDDLVFNNEGCTCDGENASAAGKMKRNTFH